MYTDLINLSIYASHLSLLARVVFAVGIPYFVHKASDSHLPLMIKLDGCIDCSFWAVS